MTVQPRRPKRRFHFRYEGAWRWGVLPWGVTPGRSWVDLDEEAVDAHFGPWSFRVELSNVRRWSIVGPFRWWRVLGVRMTVFVWDVSFGTSVRDGVFLEFVRPERRLGLAHPGLWLTLAETEAFTAALSALGIEGGDERRLRSRP